MTQRYMDFAPVKKAATRQTGVSRGQGVASRGTVVTNKQRTVTARPATVKRLTPKQASGRSMTMKAVDFRPINSGTSANRTAVNKPVAKRPAARPVAASSNTGAVLKNRMSVGTASVKRATIYKAPANAGQAMSASKATSTGRVKLGEIEDLNPKFVKKDVPKRPLNDGSERGASRNDVAELKSKKIGGRLRLKSSRKDTAKLKNMAGKEGGVNQAQPGSSRVQSVYAVPRSPFINQDKVAKRPLSNNTHYASDREAMAVTSQMIDKKAGRKTTTIIDKPAKDSKIGMVVAIILTIILGAVAGTVAFLLLPK